MCVIGSGTNVTREKIDKSNGEENACIKTKRLMAITVQFQNNGY